MTSTSYARELLSDHIISLVAYICADCEEEFFAYDDTAKCCPFCKSDAIVVLYERDVELLDWDL
ncbi:MAG: hypothetical protein QXR93_06800 [Archaeoglobaceae archaeon]